MRSLALFVLFCTLVETAPAEAFSLPPEGGSLNTRRLRRAIRLRRRTLQPCYRRYLQRRTKKMPHTGKVKAHFLLKAGKVSQVTIRTETFDDGRFLRCLQRIIQGWDLSRLYRRTRRVRRPCTTRETDAGKRRCYDVKPKQYLYKSLQVSTPFSFWPKQLRGKKRKPRLPPKAPKHRPKATVRTRSKPSPGGVLRRLLRRRAGFRVCLERHLRRDHRFRPRHGLLLQIGTTGRVSHFSFPAPKSLQRCVGRWLRRLRFRAPGQSVRVCWPIVGLPCAPKQLVPLL